MKKVLLAAVAVALCSPPAVAAPNTPTAQPIDVGEFGECGTVLEPGQAAAYLQYLADRGPTELDALAGGPYYMPIAPHIVRHDDGTGGLPIERYEQAILDANEHYAPVGFVFFTVASGIDFIDDDDFWTTSSLDEIDELRTTNTVSDAINIYFTENLNYENGSLCGISAFTFSSVQAIAMRNSCTANDAGLGNHSTFSHEIGHYFNLFHTHETAFDDELVDGSNCDEAGDLLCDTPADPVLTSFTVDSKTCEYTGSEEDDNGDPYDPDCTLLMSYSLKHCRDVFSPESFVRMEETLVNERPNLITDVVAAPLVASRGVGVTLSEARPNPARGVTELSFSLDHSSAVDVTIYDVRGARVQTIARSPFNAGEHRIAWDGSTELGTAAAPGIYFVRLRAADAQLVRKVQRLR